MKAKSALVVLPILVTLTAPLMPAAAYASDMQGMDMNGMKKESPPNAVVHETTGVVKQLDESNGLVTIAHGPVATLKWQAMTMSFKVKDASLLKKLKPGKEVKFGFVHQSGDYIVTRVK